MGRLLRYRTRRRDRVAGLRAPGGRSLFQLRSRAALVSASAALCLLAGACGGEDQPASRYSSCIDVDSVDEKKPPRALRMPEGLTITAVEQNDGFVTVIGVADMTVEEIFGPAEEALVASGFEILQRDFEGFEAELFFAKGNSTAGVVRIRIGPCPQQVTLTFLYDPLETKKGRDVLEKARERAHRRNTSPNFSN